MTYIIPVTVVDSFFENPFEVRNYALTQEFNTDPEFSWPGKRTAPMHTINQKLFDFVINKSLRLFYPATEQYQYEASMYFQMSNQQFGKGWVHADVDHLITGIIYLNPTATLDSGTSIYQAKNTGADPIHSNIKQDFHMGKIENCDEARDENNNQFEETVVIKNKFNRLVLFDSHLFHSANEFVGNSIDTDRLTLVFFISKLFIPRYPIQRMMRLV